VEIPANQASTTFDIDAVDDDIDADDQNLTITATASGFEAGILSVTVQDDDTAGITVDPTSLSIDEGNSNTFTITLDSKPTADVTITLSKENDECSISPTSVTLTDSNWNTGKKVTVSATDDDVDDGNQSCDVTTDDAASADTKYNGMTVG
jgi:hypothetical protein